MVRLAIRVQRAQAEIVLAELLEVAPSGVEEVDVGPDVVEYAVYGPPGELPLLGEVRAAAGTALVEVSTTEVPDDWAERWRQFHRPLVLDGRLTVRPPWEPAATTPIDIVVDPGRAFGTGAHATTRLCLEALLEIGPGETFLDVGCGSGVLAIAAAKLGWRRVIALDNDPAAVSATGENAQRNGVVLEVARHDVRTEAIPPADAAAANLLGPLLVSWAARLSEQPGVPRLLVASGLLTSEADRLAEAFAAAGLRERRRSSLGEWAALVLERAG